MRALADPRPPETSPAVERNDRDETPREADARLVDALLRQEPAAGDALYARYASRVYGLGLALLKNRADAEDLVQDTFFKVLRTGSAFDPRRGSLDVWILLTARSPVPDWPISLPDLASRLRAAPAVAIGPPDEALLGALLVKLFGDRQLVVAEDVIRYMLAHMERSFAAARALVAALDERSLEQHRAITIPLVRAVLEQAEPREAAPTPGL